MQLRHLVFKIKTIGLQQEEWSNKWRGWKKKLPWPQKKLAYCTKYSQVVTHPGTNLARCCLTYEIRRERVCSAWYGRRHWQHQSAKISNDFLGKSHFEKFKSYSPWKKKEAYSTKYSQAVTHPGTNLARCCLTYEIRRERVCSAWYGRRHWQCQKAGTSNHFWGKSPFWTEKVHIIFTLEKKCLQKKNAYCTFISGQNVGNAVVECKRIWFDSIGKANCRQPLISAVQLLTDTGIFGCWVSPLARCTPPQATWSSWTPPGRPCWCQP